jgi:hypothetical protein
MNIYLLTGGGGTAAQSYGLAAQANFGKKKDKGGAHTSEKGVIRKNEKKQEKTRKTKKTQLKHTKTISRPPWTLSSPLHAHP